jgi:hypothetical protein
LPFVTSVRVTAIETGQSVVVRINDRGPFGGHGRILDLSRRAAEQLGMMRAGVLNEWTDKSFGRLVELMPGRYAKHETDSAFLAAFKSHVDETPVSEVPDPSSNEGLAENEALTESAPVRDEVLADVYLSTNPVLLERLAAGLPLPGEARIYAGHAGWAPGQLQGEIARGGWWVTPADIKAIFDQDSATVWPELVKRLSTRRTSIRLPP